jgi:hypothetical protein
MQIVQRVLKLIDLLPTDAPKAMFVQVLRDCPQDVILAHKSQLQDILSFE